jgi:hypothetical protein
MDILREWITSGRVQENDRMKGTILTGGEWARVGDLKIYYLFRGLELPSETNRAVTVSAGSDPRGRYSTLCKISTILNGLAIVVLLLSIVVAIYFGRVSFGTASLIAILQGLITAVLIWALAEMILLLIDVEYNTRATATNTTRLLASGDEDD